VDIESYTEQAIRGAAECLQWQACDSSEDGGNGYPITDGGDEYTDAVAEVPYLVEAVTNFVADTWETLRKWSQLTPGQVGHDLVLTANGHGTGFWDRGLDMPANDSEAYAAYMQGRAFYKTWLADNRPYPGDYPQTVGRLLTNACRGYSFDAEFQLWGDRADDDEHCSDEVAWLCVEGTVIVDTHNREETAS
jgi:hypothetical protein